MKLDKWKGSVVANENSDRAALAFAISREVDAYHFYMALAGRADRIEIKKVLGEFAQEELEHKAKLELELIKTGQTVPVEDEPPRTSEPSIPPNTDLRLEINYKELLVLAMQKEEASFRTYVGLVPTMRSEESRDVLLAIAEEEVKHKLRFEMEYDILSKQT